MVARKKGLTPKNEWLNRGLTFVAVVVAWVFFRAATLEQAGRVLKAMAGLNGLGSLYSAKVQIGYAFTLLVFAGLAWVNLTPNTWEIDVKPTWRYGIVFGLLLGAAVLAMGRPAEFVCGSSERPVRMARLVVARRPAACRAQPRGMLAAISYVRTYAQEHKSYVQAYVRMCEPRSHYLVSGQANRVPAAAAASTGEAPRPAGPRGLSVASRKP